MLTEGAWDLSRGGGYDLWESRGWLGVIGRPLLSRGERWGVPRRFSYASSFFQFRFKCEETKDSL